MGFFVELGWLFWRLKALRVKNVCSLVLGKIIAPLFKARMLN
jgi:hypothetical protein